MNAKELCIYLSSLNGTSGDEIEVCDAIKNILSEKMQVTTDTLGSVSATFGTGKHKIMLDAHVDSIGLVVRAIDDKGFLLVSPVGGVDGRVLVGSEVTVFGKKKLAGVVCSTPPHLQHSEAKADSVSIKELAIDVGLSKAEAEKLVEVQDRVVLGMECTELLGNKIAASSLDNRSGAAAILLALNMLPDTLKNTSVTAVFSTQEETGGSGAKVSAYLADCAEAIVVDSGFGSDAYCDSSETIDLGKGPSIGLSPILDRDFTNRFISLAKEKNISYQHDVMSGKTGTNADHISITRSGVPCVLLSIPLRYMHTCVEVIDVDDVEATARLIAEYILEKEREVNA